MSDEIKYAYLNIHPLFAGSTGQRIMEACSIAKVKSISRNGTLNFGEGGYSKLYLLIEGKIKIMECDTMDNELVKDILSAPDLFGDLGLAGNPSVDEFAQALTADTVVCVFNSLEFKKMLSGNPLMAVNYANAVNNKLKKT